MYQNAKLPYEILTIIFSHVESAYQIAQCRLVCRAWNPPAQVAQYASHLSIPTETMANQLCDYLAQHPHCTSMIKAIDVNIPSPLEDDGFMKLTELVFTPKMSSFTGNAESERFFNKLMEIAGDTGTAGAFSHLKAIPHLTRNGRTTYEAALLMFKSTLESMHLTFHDIVRWNFVNKLPGFNRLKELYLDLAIPRVNQLNIILNKCPQIEDLNIHFVQRGPAADFRLIILWVEREQKHSNMKTLRIYGECRLELLQYLMMKCPNVDRVHIDMTQRDAPWNTYEHRVALDAGGMIAIVKTLRHYQRSFYSLKFRLGGGGGNLKQIKNNIIVGRMYQILICNSSEITKEYPLASDPFDSYQHVERHHHIEFSKIVH